MVHMLSVSTIHVQHLKYIVIAESPLYWYIYIAPDLVESFPNKTLIFVYVQNKTHNW